MKEHSSHFILFLFISTLLTGMTACGPSDDELMLRANIQSMRQAITEHKSNTFMKYIHKDYKSPIHNDINALRDFVNYHLRSHRVIYVYMADIEIEIKDNTAKIIFYSGTAGGPEQIPERGRLFKVGTRWLKENGQWKVTQAKWRPALVLRKHE